MPKIAQETATATHVDADMLRKVAETRLKNMDEAKLIPLDELCAKYKFTPRQPAAFANGRNR